jgi:polysaccharide export outer membrane protein
MKPRGYTYRYILIINVITFLISIFSSMAGAADEAALKNSRVAKIKRYYKEGKRMMETGDYRSAIDSFKRIMELEEGFYSIITPYAKEYIRLAEERLDETGPADIKMRSEIEKRQLEERESQKLPVAESIEAGRIARIKSYYKEGKDKMSRGDYDGAIESFRRVIELEKGYYSVITPYAEEYIKLSERIVADKRRERSARLKERLERERRREKEEISTILEKAKIKIEDKEARDLKAAEAAEKARIYKVKAYHQQAKELIALEKYHDAIDKFDKVIELEKDFYPIYTPYAEDYIEWCREMLAERKQMEIRKTVERRRLEKAREIERGVETELTVLEARERSLEYKIGKSDALYVHVWEEDTLSQEVIVRPDGRISFPLAGDMRAEGLTFTELKQEITGRLKEYIRHPVVSVSLRKMGGRKVIVMGEVKEAGVYTVTGNCTMLEAIAYAKGFTKDSVPSSTILIRGGILNPQGRRVNLTQAIDRQDHRKNIILEAEDIIYVPKKFIANVNYAVDQIITPLAKGALIVTTFGLAG